MSRIVCDKEGSVGQASAPVGAPPKRRSLRPSLGPGFSIPPPAGSIPPPSVHPLQLVGLVKGGAR